MSKLRLSFLGPPLVERDGTPVTITRRKVLALLAYLAVSGHAHGRDELTDLLYPRHDRDRAMADFRTVLSVLRQFIGTDSLVIDGERVGLRWEDGIRVDVREMRALLTEARSAEKGGDEAVVERLLVEATGLVRGEFLAGFTLCDSARFDEWEEQEREGLQGEEAQALERLTAIREARGAHGEAIAVARRRLMLDPLDERTVRDLMRLHAREGNRTAALRQYDRLVALLKKETGGRPEAETAALRERIAGGRLATADRCPAGGVAIDRPSTNLRHPPTALIGRRRELAAVIRGLAGDGARLVTLTGPGGIGKTRLALEAAWRLLGRFEHGAWLVDLAPVTRPAGVVSAIAAALGVQETRDAPRDAPTLPARRRVTLGEQLEGYLRSRRLLLVLDTFERVCAAAEAVAGLLGACPGVKVLATSRQALHLRGERVIEVPPLGFSEDGRANARSYRCEAVRLFAERAAAGVPGFSLDAETAPAVLEICRMLDGTPLAIELAATKVKTFAPPELLKRLARRLQVLEDGPCDLPARQRTLRGEIDWSFELLDVRERCLFACLAVFPGGATEAAAAAVCEPPDGCGTGGVGAVLESLADRSLVQRRQATGQVRYHQLDTIREYAEERLERGGDAPRVRERALEWMVALVTRAEPHLYGPDQDRWFAEIEAEYPNLHAAMVELERRGDGERLVQLAGSLGWFWFRRARFTEGANWLKRALGWRGGGTAPGLRAKAHHALALIRRCAGFHLCRNPDVQEHAREAIRLAQAAGDRRLEALSLALLGTDEMEDLWDEGIGFQISVDGVRHLDQAVEVTEATGDGWVVAWCRKLAYSWVRRNDLEVDVLRARMDEAIALARGTGDPFLLCQVLAGMGTMLNHLERHVEARPFLEESLRIAREIDDRWSTLGALYCLGSSLFNCGNIEAARRRWTEGLRLAVDIGAMVYLHHLLGGFDHIARKEGRPRRAMTLMSAAVQCAFPDQPFESMKHEPWMGPPLGVDVASLEAEWYTGQALTLEDAIAYALSDED
jgi:predicted ATPase/DNA-binding SARP family transcriptional activator